MKILNICIISAFLYLSSFSALSPNAVHSSAVGPMVIDTIWQKTSNWSVDRSPCQSLAPTDSYWTWTNNVWDGEATYNLPGLDFPIIIPDYVPGYWTYIDYPVPWDSDYIPGYEIPDYVPGTSYPRPQVHEWFKTTLNLPSVTNIAKIELIGFFKQQYGGVITVNDNLFVFVNPNAFTLDEIVAYGGTAVQDWVGFPSDLTDRLPPPPVYCDWSAHGGVGVGGVEIPPCQVTHYIAPEMAWYIDPLELPIEAFQQGNNVVYVLLEEFCGGGELGHLAFRINAPQRLGFSSSGPASVAKGLAATYTANYKITANVDLTNIKVQGGIGSKATNIVICFDGESVANLPSLTSGTWGVPGGTLKLGVSKSTNVFSLTMSSMVKGESHTLSVAFDWTFKSTGIQEITGRWSAVCTSMFGTLKTPYTGVITVKVA